MKAIVYLIVKRKSLITYMDNIIKKSPVALHRGKGFSLKKLKIKNPVIKDCFAA
jgi:hypothetical protein